MERDVIHTALWVSNLETTVDFYTNGLDLDRNWEFTSDGVRNVYLGGPHGEFQFKHDPNGDYDTGTGGGLAHVAVGVESTDDAFEQLAEHSDPPVVKPPTTMSDIDRRVAFVEDPDGYVVELVEQL